MSTEYIWFKGGKESKRTADPKGEKPTLVKSGNGREIKYSYHYDLEADEWGDRIRSVSSETHTLNGENDREGGKPAFISYYKNGIVSHHTTFKNGVPQTVTINREDGSVDMVKHYTDGVLYSDGDKPAVLYYFSDGTPLSETWYDVDGDIHRDGGKPASIFYNSGGGISAERWYQHGDPHREDDKPAVINYYPDGNIRDRRYFYDGEVYTPQK
jgi:antitoxin component YwqK of YwqJK toxin-antitoxin module